MKHGVGSPLYSTFLSGYRRAIKDIYKGMCLNPHNVAKGSLSNSSSLSDESNIIFQTRGYRGTQYSRVFHA